MRGPVERAWNSAPYFYYCLRAHLKVISSGTPTTFWLGLCQGREQGPIWVPCLPAPHLSLAQVT